MANDGDECATVERGYEVNSWTVGEGTLWSLSLIPGVRCSGHEWERSGMLIVWDRNSVHNP